MPDLILRNQIVGEVRRAMSEMMTSIEERWVTPKELSKQFAFFTEDWLRHYGHLIPRERIVVTHLQDNAKESRTTAWAYPLHKINLMVINGDFRELEWKEKISEFGENCGENATGCIERMDSSQENRKGKLGNRKGKQERKRNINQGESPLK